MTAIRLQCDQHQRPLPVSGSMVARSIALIRNQSFVPCAASDKYDGVPSNAGLPTIGRLAAFRLHAVRNPQSFLCPSPPSFRPHHSLPSARSFRNVEIRGERRLMSHLYHDLPNARVNVTTPHADLIEILRKKKRLPRTILATSLVKAL